MLAIPIIIISIVFFYLAVFSIFRWFFWKNRRELSGKGIAILKICSAVVGLILYSALLAIPSLTDTTTPTIGARIFVASFFLFLILVIVFGIYCEIVIRKEKLI